MFVKILAALALALAVATAEPAAAAPRFLDTGHSDIAPHVFEDGAVRLGVHTDDGVWSRLGETVFVVGEEGRLNLPAGNGRPGLGLPGAEVWFLPAGQQRGLLWPGLAQGDAPAGLRDHVVVLEGVRGPGDVVIGSGAGSAADPLQHRMSTRVGLPAGTPLSSYHFHVFWGFGGAGRYCLALRLEGVDAGGRPYRDRAQLTVITAGVDRGSLVRCEDGDGAPLAPIARRPQAARGGPPFVAGPTRPVALRPELDGDALHVGASPLGTVFPAFDRSLDDVLVHARESAPSTAAHAWEGAPGTAVHRLRRALQIDTLRIDPDRADGPLTLRLRGVTGPAGATLSLADPRDPLVPALSTAPGFERDATTFWAEQATTDWVASAPGRYCVDLDWSLPLRTGGTAVARQTLTLLVDRATEERTAGGTLVPVPSAFGDPAAQQPCGRAGHDPHPLEQGHVDLALRLLDGQLEPSLRAADVRRHPATAVVTAGSEARATLPADPLHAFLGEPGAPLWLLPEVEDRDLPWLGWSTDELTGAELSEPVRWTLTGVRGPGHVALFQSGTLSGEPDVLFNTRRALPQTRDIALGTHAHGTWAFAARGTYCLDLRASSRRADGTPIATDFALKFAIDAPATACPDERPAPVIEPPAPDVPAPPTPPMPDPVAPAAPLPPAPTATTQAPLRVSGVTVPRSLRLTTLRARGVTVRLRAPARGTRVRAQLSVTRATARRLGLRRTTLATQQQTARAATRLTVRLRPAAGVRRTLARVPRSARRVDARVDIRVTHPDGRVATLRRSVRLTLR